LEASPTDPVIAWAMRDTFPRTRDLAEPWLRLLAAVNREEWASLDRDEVPDVDRAIRDVLLVKERMKLDDLVAEVADRLGIVPGPGTGLRVKNSHFCCLLEGDFVRLADTDAPDGRPGRRLKRLSAMRRVLEAEGPLHYSDLADKIRCQLGDDALTERNVHAWLDRYDDQFTWVGPGTYRLRQPTDENLGRETLPERYAPRRRRGIGDAIASLLLERQPRSLAEIESHILPHFVVGRASVLASIIQDHAHRFVMTDGHQVYLSDADISAFECDKPKVAGGIDWSELAAELADFAGNEV